MGWQGLPIEREVRLYSLLPNQSWNWHESFSPRRPSWMDQGQHRQTKGQMRGIERTWGGESGGQTGHTYDISNKHRLGHSEVSLVQTMIDGVNTLWQEDLVFQKTFNHLSQTKTAATIKKLKRKMKEHLKSMRK